MRVLVANALVFPALLGQVPGQLQDLATSFSTGTVRVDDAVYPYRLLRPLAGNESGPSPLVVFLHGAGERGSDNLTQLTWLPEVLGSKVNRKRLPCHLLAVQCPSDERWVQATWDRVDSEPMHAEPTRALRAVVAAMDRVQREENVDPARVYLTGLSMGGFGCWDLAARMPDRFAAMLAICGGGDERIAGRLLGLPICVYHGDSDGIVPVQRSRGMVEALRRLGASVRYRELQGVGHESWRQAYGDGGALPWLFDQDQRQQARGMAAEIAVIPAPDARKREGGVFALRAGARCVAGEGCHRAATLFAAAVASRYGLRLEVVSGTVADGDVGFEIVPDMAAAIEVSVDGAMRVAVAEPAALSRGAAMACQALSTWPDAQCPRGTFSQTALAAGGEVVIGGDGEAWDAQELVELVRLAWLSGALAVHGDRLAMLDWLSPKGITAVRGAAALAGIELCSGVIGPASGLVVELGTEVDLGDLLGRACPEQANWRLIAPAIAPSRQLELLAVALPAVAERAARPRLRLHVGSLASRLGSLLRR